MTPQTYKTDGTHRRGEAEDDMTIIPQFFFGPAESIPAARGRFTPMPGGGPNVVPAPPAIP